MPPPQSLPPPSEGQPLGGDGGCLLHGFSQGLPSPLQPFDGRGEGGGGTARASDSAGASDSAASLPGVGVLGSSRSQDSLVLAGPSPVDFSVSAGGDRQSHSCEVGGFTRACSRSRSSRLSPSRGRDSREERCCARSRSRGSRD